MCVNQSETTCQKQVYKPGQQCTISTFKMSLLDAIEKLPAEIKIKILKHVTQYRLSDAYASYQYELGLAQEDLEYGVEDVQERAREDVDELYATAKEQKEAAVEAWQDQVKNIYASGI